MKTPHLRIGKMASLLAFLFTAVYVIIQLLQLFRLIPYPFDEILIYGSSLCIVIPFVLAVLALHYNTAPQLQIWTHAVLIFTVMYAVYVTANYVVQLATVIPMTLNGESAKIALLVQYPHSLFWDFDAMGYILMGIACAFATPVFKKQGFERFVRLAFLANALATPLITIVYFYPVYTEKLLMLGLTWAVTAPAFMLMMHLYFRKKIKEENLLLC